MVSSMQQSSTHSSATSCSFRLWDSPPVIKLSGLSPIYMVMIDLQELLPLGPCTYMPTMFNTWVPCSKCIPTSNRTSSTACLHPPHLILGQIHAALTTSTMETSNLVGV